MKISTAGIQALVCLFSLSPLWKCEAGSVRLFSGECCNGTLGFDNFGLKVTTPKHELLKFDLSNVFEASFEDSSANKPSPFPPGVFLTNGAFIAGAVKSLEDPTVKLGSKTLELTVKREAIASVVFTSMPRAKIDRIPKTKTGVLFPNEDFFSGTVYGLKKNGAMVNSNLLGTRTFVPGTQITALVLREIQAAPTRYEVSTRDGSRFQVNDVKVDHDVLLVNDSILGPVKISVGDLAAIRAGSWRYHLLTDLKPLASGTSTDPVLPAQGENSETLLIGDNVPVSYQVPPGFTFFSSSVAVAETVPATTRLVFAVYADGKPVYKTLPMGSDSGIQSVRANLGVAQRITLRVETTTQGLEAPSGKWIQPLFQRP